MSICRNLNVLLTTFVFAGTSLFASSADPVGPAPKTTIHKIVSLNADELPGAIIAGLKSDLYVGFPLLNQIRRYSQKGDLLGVKELPVSGSMTEGIAQKWNGNIYAVVNTFFGGSPSDHGVWEIRKSGEISQFVELPPGGSLTDIVFDKCDHIYVSDSVLGVIWKINRLGEITEWVNSPLLFGIPGGRVVPGVPMGANGLAMGSKNRHLYVSNTDMGRILRIKIHDDGSAGDVEIFSEEPYLIGIVGISFNLRGQLYATIPYYNKIIAVNKLGAIEEVYESKQLDFPGDIVMKSYRGINSGYFTNSALPDHENPGIFYIKIACDYFHSE